jgi:hypothetical protein
LSPAGSSSDAESPGTHDHWDVRNKKTAGQSSGAIGS